VSDRSPFEIYGRANPQSDAFLVEHVFRAGDRLSLLAQQYLGNWRLWRLIADRNDVIDARRIPVGTRLLIPRQPTRYGRFDST
jgi:nucleoid-associated protein YgaU